MPRGSPSVHWSPPLSAEDIPESRPTDPTYLRETLKPNLSGWSANSFFRSVDFPVPDGPKTTSGLENELRGDIPSNKESLNYLDDRTGLVARKAGEWS